LQNYGVHTTNIVDILDELTHGRIEHLVSLAVIGRSKEMLKLKVDVPLFKSITTELINGVSIQLR